MKVKEVMNADVLSLKPEDNALEALNLLLKRNISGLPVIGSDGKLAGMFTEKGVLSHILPGYIEQVGAFVYDGEPKSTKKKFAELKTMKVSQIMRKEVITANEDASLSEVARIMLTQKSRRLPVLDKAGRVVGIVARCDIIKAFAKEADMDLRS